MIYPKPGEQVKVGQNIKFWSNKVFGVPVVAQVKRVDKDGFLYLNAYYNGVGWNASKVHPDRVLRWAE